MIADIEKRDGIIPYCSISWWVPRKVENIIEKNINEGKIKEK
tara:strand:+ start:1236 stop:1361 length:126 start_codon:yes stop_codon:yes gene_type:complete